MDEICDKAMLIMHVKYRDDGYDHWNIDMGALNFKKITPCSQSDILSPLKERYFFLFLHLLLKVLLTLVI